jgi:hypothetical protein
LRSGCLLLTSSPLLLLLFPPLVSLVYVGGRVLASLLVRTPLTVTERWKLSTEVLIIELNF